MYMSNNDDTYSVMRVMVMDVFIYHVFVYNIDSLICSITDKTVLSMSKQA